MKDYFYFTQSQKAGIYILLIIVVALIAANETLPYWFGKSETDDRSFMAEVAQFRKSLKDETEKQPHYTTTTATEKRLMVFNPNTLDSAGFVSLGIRPKIVQNILKYRSKGGYFRTPQDFSKVYGISEQQFNELLPYISIPKKEIAEQHFAEKKETFKPEAKSEQEVFTIELNACDTTELKKLKGIGSVYAQRIVKYRQMLGGFVSKEQISEVFGLTPENLRNFEKFMTVDAKLVKKILVNKASVERLKSHPYLNFYASKAIYEQRLKLGKLSSTDDLRGLKDLSDETLEKIAPYLSFE